MVIDDAQRVQLADDGIVRLKRVVPQRAAVAREAVLAALARLGYRTGGKWHTRQLDGMPPFQVAARLSQTLPPGLPIADLIPAELVAELSTIAQGRLRPAHPTMQLLVTPPQKQEGGIPTLGWHVDAKEARPGQIPGLQVFVLLDDLLPGGGATMAIKGSHRVKGLRPEPERVAEMTGHAGDVYVMDMRVQHAPSINATTRARLMATARFIR
jgi:hypothetical protein